MGVGEDTDAWPEDPTTGKQLVRFDRRTGKHGDAVNTKALHTTLEHIQAAGNQISNTTKATLAQVLP